MNKEYELDLKVAEMALSWGNTLAFEDHHETVFEELLGKLEGDEYWLALERAKDTLEEIWEAGKLYLEMQKEALEIIRNYEDKGTIELAVAYERLRGLVLIYSII